MKQPFPNRDKHERPFGCIMTAAHYNNGNGP